MANIPGSSGPRDPHAAPQNTGGAQQGNKPLDPFNQQQANRGQSGEPDKGSSNQ